MAAALAVCMVASMTGCGKSKVALNDGEFQEVDKAELEFPLKEKNRDFRYDKLSGKHRV